MTHPVLSRALTAGTIAVLVAAAGATSAFADEPASLSLSSLDTLTLPAADGVRDSQQLTITATQPTTVALAVRRVGEESAIALAPVEIVGASATVTIDVAGLPAGSLEVVATPAGGAEVVAPLTVGSGAPVDVSLSLSKSTLFTYNYSSATPRSATATVTATDETGLGVAFTGNVTAVVGGKAKVVTANSTTGSPAKVTLSSTGLGYGAGTAFAEVKGKEGTTNFSEDVALNVRQLAFSSVSVSTSSASVYPYKDYYHDSVKITVTPKTSAGVTFGASGSVKITRNGTTVKSWTLTSSAPKVLTWDGRVNSKIVPGTYKITATIKGKEGTTKTYSKLVTVKSQKLVTKTRTVNYRASSVMKSYNAFDDYQLGECTNYTDTGEFDCDSYGADAGDEIALVDHGYVSVPSDIVSAEKFGGASVKVYVNLTDGYGSGAWAYDTEKWGTTKWGDLVQGKSTLGSLKLPSSSTKVHVSFWLGEYSWIVGDKFSMVYTYKALVS